MFDHYQKTSPYFGQSQNPINFFFALFLALQSIKSAGLTFSIVLLLSAYSSTLSAQCQNITLQITLDNFPEETFWQVVDAGGNPIWQGGEYPPSMAGMTIVENNCLPFGCYEYVIFDANSNGICCTQGMGSYTLTNTTTGEVLANGGEFNEVEITPFCLDNCNMPPFVEDQTIKLGGNIAPIIPLGQAGSIFEITGPLGTIQGSQFGIEEMVAIGFDPYIANNYEFALVEITNTGCISPPHFFYILVVDNPIASILVEDLSICAGTSTNLTARALLGNPPYTYQWSHGPTTPFVNIAPNITTHYSVTVTDAFGCQAVSSQKILVNQNGYLYQPTNQLIVKIPNNLTADSVATLLCGSLVSACNCDTLALIEFPEIAPNSSSTPFDIEEKKRNAQEELEIESNPNYSTKYCGQTSLPSPCIAPADNPILSPITIGLIDSGIDLPFAQQYTSTSYECGTNTTDGIEANAGLIGFNPIDYENFSLQDNLGHGTHLSGILAQDTTEALDVFVAKVIDPNATTGSLYHTICAFHFFANFNQVVPSDEQVNVVNLSMGSYGPKPIFLEEAIEKGGQSGMLVVCSAGNSGEDIDTAQELRIQADSIVVVEELIIDTIPSSRLIDTLFITTDCKVDTFIVVDYPPVDTLAMSSLLGAMGLDSVRLVIDTLFRDSIRLDSINLNHWPSEFDSWNIVSVAAWDNNTNDLAGFSNRGALSVDFAVPGVGVQSKIPLALDTFDGLADGLEVKDGSSQATAFATRHIARLMAKHPSLSAPEILSLLESQLIAWNTLSGKVKFGGLLPVGLSYLDDCQPTTSFISCKVWLEGPYDDNTGMMRDDLRQQGLIPLVSPYDNTQVIDTSVLMVSGQNAVVDWLQVELRKAGDSTEVVERLSVLLQRDGDLVALDGISPLSFSAIGNYYLVAKHRNHLPLMTANPVVLDGSYPAYDFTSAAIHFNSNGLTEIAPSIFATKHGDTNADGTIDALDRGATWNNRNQTGYLRADINLDGVIDALDRGGSWNNRNATFVLP